VSAFPPAPWILGGWGVATLGLVDRAAAVELVPAGVHVVSVLPGKTIGGLFFVSYERGSLAYREFGVAAALVRIGSRIAFYLPRMYVDSEASLLGGRAIWGVPKERATFEIGHDIGVTSIDVRQGSHEIARLRASVPTTGFRLPLRLPTFGTRDDEYLFFTGKLTARIARARVAVDLAPGDECAPLDLAHPNLALRFENLTLTVPIPRVVARPAGVTARRSATSIPQPGS
jgi:acetoacetate decarboxylase